MLFGEKETPKDLDPAKGYSLHIGLNSVNPDCYSGWDGPLNACENDARHLEHLMLSKGFETNALYTQEATRKRVISEIELLADKAVPGDLVVVTNSSHGSQVPDFDGTEADGFDETICMFDGELIDDELEALWAKFAMGVRVFFISDSCHSGTMARLVGSPSMQATLQSGVRVVPHDVATRTFLQNRDALREQKASARARRRIQASLLAFGACQDNQVAYDGAVNGAFTGALLSAVRQYPEACPGTLIKRVRQLMPPSQSPTYVYGGPRMNSFEQGHAFEI